MPTFDFHQTTTATPEQFLAGLTDFGPGRSKLFANSADDYLEVHDEGPTQADVTEGSGGIWERLHYDWSDPSHIVLSTTDSNAWADGPNHTYNLKRGADGTTEIDYEVVRDGRTSRVACSGSCSGQLARAASKARSSNSSKPSKPETASPTTPKEPSDGRLFPVRQRRGQ
jgi:hypothetical protein